MKVARLFQPRNPLFWLMLALNGLSSALAWIAHNQAFSVFGSLLLSGFAIGNAVLGAWLAWRLITSVE